MMQPSVSPLGPLSDERIRVMVLDDHEILRKGIVALLNEQFDIYVVGEARTAEEAITVATSSQPHVALLDVGLGPTDPFGGIRACRAITASGNHVACAMLTGDESTQTRAAAREAGASAFLLKHLQGARIVDAVRRVAAGETLMTEPDAGRGRPGRAVQPKDEFSALTAQEHRILENITRGLTNRQIALSMNLAEKTVKNYVSSVLTKLGMQRRTEVAVMWAVATQQRTEQPRRLSSLPS